MTNWFTREKDEPLEDYGKRPEERSIEELMEKGFVIIDKPFGPTSNQVTAWVKDELNIKKAGHFGTLDPNATGVLPIGLNKGTRIQKLLAESDKEYIFEINLREEKDKEEIKEILDEFKGTNSQTPPKKSAVKKEEREREIYEIKLLDYNGDSFLGRVECESGFYVRVLVEQIGEKLGTKADMNELRRTRQSHLEENECWKLQDLVDEHKFWQEEKEHKLEEILKPIEYAVKETKKIVVMNSAVNAVANGANLGATGISQLQDDIKEGDTIALMTLKGELIAIAEAQMNSEEMYDEQGTAADLKSVHMDPEEYPKRWKQ